jgi:hypothetical protein
MSVDLSQYDFSTPKARRESWAKILLNGDYKQAREVLHDGEDRFCCLGVACDLYRRVEMEGEWRDQDYVIPGDTEDLYFPDADGSVKDDVADGTLNYTVRNWLGFDTDNPGVQISDIVEAIPDFLDKHLNDHSEYSMYSIGVEATALNDDFGLNFEEIGKIFLAAEKRHEREVEEED